MYQNRAMPSIVKILRVVADPNRLRILLLLEREELSVAELQEILAMLSAKPHASHSKPASVRRSAPWQFGQRSGPGSDVQAPRGSRLIVVMASGPPVR